HCTAGLFKQTAKPNSASPRLRHVDLVTAERSRNRQRVSRRIVRRSDVEIARSRSTRTRPGEASLVTLRLQTGRYAIHDVEVPSELEVRVAIDRENSVSRIERAVRVSPRRIR